MHFTTAQTFKKSTNNAVTSRVEPVQPTSSKVLNRPANVVASMANRSGKQQVEPTSLQALNKPANVAVSLTNRTGQQQGERTSSKVLNKPANVAVNLTNGKAPDEGARAISKAEIMAIVRTKYPIIFVERIKLPNDSSNLVKTAATAPAKTVPIPAGTKATPAIASPKPMSNGLQSKTAQVFVALKPAQVAGFSKSTVNSMKPNSAQQLSKTTKPTRKLISLILPFFNQPMHFGVFLTRKSIFSDQL